MKVRSWGGKREEQKGHGEAGNICRPHKSVQEFILNNRKKKVVSKENTSSYLRPHSGSLETGKVGKRANTENMVKE